jgi:hypothetical protein
VKRSAVFTSPRSTKEACFICCTLDSISVAGSSKSACSPRRERVVADLVPAKDELKASGPPTTSRLHWYVVAIVRARPDAAVADRPQR